MPKPLPKVNQDLIQATVDQIMAASRARFGHGQFQMVKATDPPPAAAPEPFPTGDDLQALTGEALTEAREAAQTEADALAAIGVADLTDDQISRLNAIGDFLDSVDGEETRRETEAAEREARANEALARVTPAAEEEDPPAGDPAEVEDPPAGDPADEDPADQAPAAVAAAARVRQMARRQRPAPRPAPAERTPALSIVAAADIGGRFSAGQRLDNMRDAARAFIERSKAFPKGRPVAGVYQKHLVASLYRDFDATFGEEAGDNAGLRITEAMGEEEMFAVLASAADPRRLQSTAGRGLVAAGGWCAPSETIYDLYAPETLDGIVNLPEVGISRGGIRFTEGPDFATIFSSAGFHQTEAEAIAGDTKNCVEVDCPDFDEVRLDAVGLCVKAPLLTNAAYPELVERWLNGTNIANQHKVAGRLLTAMEGSLATGALDYTSSAAGTPLAWGLLTALELQVEAERQARRLGDNAEMEVVVPHWTPLALRADLANRNHVGANSVSDADVMKHFADRHIQPQFVYNWSGQDLTVDNSGPKAFPSSLKAMIYAAGTFVKGTADVINLSTVYDTADLQTNVYTAAFAEDGVLLAKMRPGGRKITFPVNPNGLMAAASLNDNFGSIQS